MHRAVSTRRLILALIAVVSVVFTQFLLLAWVDFTGSVPDCDAVTQIEVPLKVCLEMSEYNLGFQDQVKLLPTGSYPFASQLLSVIIQTLGLRELVSSNIYHSLWICLFPLAFLLVQSRFGGMHNLLILLCFFQFPVTQLVMKSCSLHSLNIFFGFAGILLLIRYQKNPSFLHGALSLLFLSLSIAIKHLGLIQYLCISTSILLLCQKKMLYRNVSILLLSLSIGLANYPWSAFLNYFSDTLKHNPTFGNWQPVSIALLALPLFLPVFFRLRAI